MNNNQEVINNLKKENKRLKAENKNLLLISKKVNQIVRKEIENHETCMKKILLEVQKLTSIE